MPLYILLGILALLIFSGLKTVQQGNVAVVTVFGKYRRVIRPGLNLLIPFVETVFKRISTQNRSVELEFQAVTIDQANVYFKSMLLFSVQDDAEDSIKKVAFKFIDEKSLSRSLVKPLPYLGAWQFSRSSFKLQSGRQCNRYSKHYWLDYLFFNG